MLFSKKHIGAGEELFNYGYPKSVTKNFWERDELPGQGAAEDSLARGEGASGTPNPGRGAGKPREKGVGRRITKKHSRTILNEADSQNGIADDGKEASLIPTEENEVEIYHIRRDDQGFW